MIHSAAFGNASANTSVLRLQTTAVLQAARSTPAGGVNGVVYVSAHGCNNELKNALQFVDHLTFRVGTRIGLLAALSHSDRPWEVLFGASKTRRCSQVGDFGSPASDKLALASQHLLRAAAAFA